MVERNQVTKITPLFLKTFAQKFDLLTIFILDLSQRQIAQIGSLPECINLQIVDLSHNNLQVITGIDALTNLKQVNLGYNKLNLVDALKNCFQLEKIELQGNNIKETRTIEALVGLQKLHNLYLQEFSTKCGKNPVCGVDGYRKKILKGLPQLKSLDGFRVSVAVFDCGDIDDIGQENIPEYQCDGVFFDDEVHKFAAGKNYCPKSKMVTAEENQVKDALAECKAFLDKKESIYNL